jgi:hypothetical protein
MEYGYLINKPEPNLREISYKSTNNDGVFRLYLDKYFLTRDGLL